MRSVAHIPRVRPQPGQPIPEEWQRHGYPCAGCGVIPTHTAEAWGDTWECARCQLRQFNSIGD